MIQTVTMYLSNNSMKTRRENLSLKYVFREPSNRPADERSPLLLLLHGFGSSEEDLMSFAPQLDQRFFVVSPRAPFVLNFGGNAWFEIYFGSSPGLSINAEQYETSRQKLLGFIDEIVAEHDLDAKRVFLASFSQGAIMNYSLMLTAPEKLAGVVAMSGALVAEYLPEIAPNDKLQDFPIFVTHGIYDNVVPIHYGRQAKEFLTKLPVALDYREYPIAHHVSEESLADIANWLSKRLDKSAI